MARQKQHRRFLRFSTRMLLIVVACTAIGTRVGHRWWITRIDFLVEKCNRLVDEEKYIEAIEVSTLATELYPDSSDAELIHWKTRFAQRFQSSPFRDNDSWDHSWCAHPTVYYSED